MSRRPAWTWRLYARFATTCGALAKGGVGLLLVTHHLEDIIPEIDRVVLLRKGIVFADGLKHEMLTSDRLSSLFGTAVEVGQADGFYRAW